MITAPIETFCISASFQNKLLISEEFVISILNKQGKQKPKKILVELFSMRKKILIVINSKYMA